MTTRTMLGAIDAGSNAIRVVVAELTAAGTLDRVEAERVPVRLGHGAFTRGELDADVIEEAVTAFRHFREVFDRHGVTGYRAVATSAVRSAGNRDLLLHRLHHEAGIEVDIIDGEEEARLVRKAVVQALGPTTAPRCILDLGGGSLEVNLRALAAGAGSWLGYSLPIGTVRLVELFGLHGAIGEAEAQMIRRYAATVVQSVLPRRHELGVAAVCGGNADMLGRLYGDGHPTQPTMELAALERGLPELLSLDVEARMQRFNLRRDRAEVIAVAAMVMATVARQLGIQRMIAPGVGVREAVLLELAEAIAEQQLRAVGAHDKAVLTAARTFANRVDHDTTHGEQVRRLTRALFTQLRDVHQLPDELGVVLEVAALLHDIGEVVNTRGHHKHSEYMIRWGRIPGLDGAYREMAALLARCHRKSAADARKVIGEADLPKERRAQLRRMTALLRLADGLDSGHRERIDDLVASRAGNTIVLDLIAKDGPLPDDAELLRKADMFQEELGHGLQITVARALALPDLVPAESGRMLAMPQAAGAPPAAVAAVAASASASASA
ncbi:MAG TPA: Ppx/GppA phosphatase family protein, partial [Kofleriaceae bacterium]|nr:Ppx/GppA phosphatase family protein [Kofleriaceae bacterium]